MSDRALASLAILQVNWDRGHDYIEGFVPFVAEALSDASQDQISLGQLQQGVRVLFGFNIPLGALKTILGRAYKRGLVKLQNRVYLRLPDALAKYDTSNARAAALRRVNSLIDAFIAYVHRKHSLELSREAAEEALLSYVEGQSVPILMSVVEGSPLALPDSASGRATFLAASFSQHICEEEPTLFSDLEMIVKGSMLANVLLYPNLGEVEQRFEDVQMYLDTPIVLRAIGMATPALQAPTIELLELLYQLNAQLCCFDSTLEEVRRVLSATSHALKSAPSRGDPHFELDEFLLKEGITSSSVELKIGKLPSLLSSRRIRVKQRPEHENPLGVDEAALEKALRARILYKHDESLHHDIDALTSIHRIRRGRLIGDLESCKAIFVTSNAALAQVGAEFFCGSRKQPSVPPAVLDHVLATLAWLKSPTRAPELPRKRLIASCHTSYQPSESLWRKYLARISQLQEEGTIGDDDYMVLRFSTEARRMLMDVTAGDPAAFVEGTPDEVLSLALAEIRAESERKAQAERDRRLKAEQDVAAAKEKQRQLAERVRSISVRRAAVVSTAAMGIVFPLLLAAAYATLPEPFPKLSFGWARLILPVALGFAAVFGLLNLVFGTSLKTAKRALEVRLASAFERKMRRSLGIQESEDK